MSEIRVACDVVLRVPYQELVPFQGDLKTLSDENYEKLKASIVRNGITMPSYVWEHDGKLHTLDGHQRCKVYARMELEGIVVPPVPIVKVQAESEARAKEILLTMVSQYGKVDSQGLYDFMQEADISFTDLDAFSIPEFNLKSFGAQFFDQDTPASSPSTVPARTGAVELDEASFETFDHTCPRCSFSFNEPK